jgi:hypothetical protein
MVGLIVLVVLLLFLAMGIAHMLRTGSVGKAFAFGEIRQIIGRIGWGKYIVWILVLVVIGVVYGAVIGLLNFVIPLGSIIGILLSPLVVVFFARSVGQIYNDGAPEYTRSYPTAMPPAPGGPYMAPPPPPAAPGAPAPGFCMNCGARLQPQNKFCPSCGQPVR